MRLSSYRKLLWIIALLTVTCIAASAQAPPGVTPTQAAVMAGASQPQLAQSVKPQAKNADARAQAANQVETAGIVPDSASLLPVAALVGFSFLLGGIVCGTIKTRH